MADDLLPKVAKAPQSTQGWRHHPWLGFSAL
jgi:hypothetical protein